MEIENAIFQDLESFGEEGVFKMAMEKLGFVSAKVLKLS